ncbi:MAG: hypothetical protein B7C24_15785 [Bacteroidetes bacterium 4572_77]|nr:MAG: hypothetical protein B7C24_15785 [Bacteroidetes bacterium 4572_77]
MGKKLTLEYVKEMVPKLAEGYKCLSTKYNGYQIYLEFRCDKGHEYKATWKTFRKGSRCRKCAYKKMGDAKRLSLDLVKKETKELAPGYECIADEYNGNNIPLKFKCDKGHEYKAAWNKFKRGDRCTECSGKRKLTIEYIKKEVEKIGYKCLSTTYTPNTKLKLQCDKGHTYTTIWGGFQAGHRCRKCVHPNITAQRKLAFNYVKKTVEQAGHTLLTTNYLNISTKLKIQCVEGHIFTPTFTAFKRNPQCQRCNSKRPTIEDIHKKIEEYGYKLLTKEYNGCSTELEIECDKGHTFLTNWIRIKSGSKCSKCSGTHQLTKNEVKSAIEKEGYKLISTTYKNAHTPIEVECDKGHRYPVVWNSFQRGGRCPICDVELRSARQVKYTKEQVKKEIEECGYAWLSDAYKNTYTELLVKCNREHIFTTTFGRFHQGHRCQKCHYKSQRIHNRDMLEKIEWYRAIVKEYSNENYSNYIKQINPNRFPRSFREYHLDHIYTVIDGFNNGILPQIIANPTNLQMLPMSENIRKHSRSDITRDELFERYNHFCKHGIETIPIQIQN